MLRLFFICKLLCFKVVFLTLSSAHLWELSSIVSSGNSPCKLPPQLLAVVQWEAYQETLAWSELYRFADPDLFCYAERARFAPRLWSPYCPCKVSSGSCSGSSLAQAREPKGGGGNAAGTGGWSCQQFLLYMWDGYDQWPMYKSSYTLLRGENNQGHLAEIPESSSWAVENKQLFSHVLQHRFVFKRMLKSTLSQLSLHLPRVWWIFIWIHAKRGSLPLRAQKELEKNVFCLPSTQTTFYADWWNVL